ncbi:MAG: hypothetical protein Q8N77_05505 [Nanoarchaeota archaeon]|nr:hypothetical protein [Nanoarchaeota archaeon]
MKALNKLLVLSAALIGLYGLTNGAAISRADEKRVPESKVEQTIEGPLYGGLKAVGAVMESELLEDYTIRIEDQNGDGGVDRYSIIDKSGNRVYEILKDLETGNVYSKSTLPGRAIDGKDLKLEDPDALDRENHVLQDPERYGFEVAQIFYLN